MSNEKSIKNAIKLIKDVEMKIDKWNERSSFTLKGVKNLSKSDLDSLVLYAQKFIENNGRGFYGYMKPLGSIKNVLDSYGISEQCSFDSLYC
jgi:hypothetical protein